MHRVPDAEADWISAIETAETPLRLFLYLLPGLLTAEIIAALTVRTRRSVLDRVIQALLYTFLDNLTWIIIRTPFGSTLDRAPHRDLIGLGLVAISWGVLMTWIVNSGKLHNLLRNRRFRLTKRTSRPNEWYDAFFRFEDFVVIHLHDGRRLFGWPLLYPDSPEQGHLLLSEAEWLDSDNRPTRDRRVSIMISVSDIRFVEFVSRPKQEQRNGEQ